MNLVSYCLYKRHTIHGPCSHLFTSASSFTTIEILAMHLSRPLITLYLAATAMCSPTLTRREEHANAYDLQDAGYPTRWRINSDCVRVSCGPIMAFFKVSYLSRLSGSVWHRLQVMILDLQPKMPPYLSLGTFELTYLHTNSLPSRMLHSAQSRATHWWPLSYPHHPSLLHHPSPLHRWK